jgi:hypothetical protein
MEEPYSSIREILHAFIGERLLDVTQQDEADFIPGSPSEVFLHFGNGQTLHFWIEDRGFDILGVESEEE